MKYLKWLLRIFSWDGLLPVCVVFVPQVMKLMFPNIPAAIEIAAIVLPISAFFLRVVIGFRQIAEHQHLGILRKVQYVSFSIAILLLVLIECVLILSNLMPAGALLAANPVASGTDPGTAVYNQVYPQDTTDIYIAGGASPFGTVAQAGNVWEWEETAVDLVNDDPLENRGFRGGSRLSSPTSISSFFRHYIRPPDSSGGDRGFRVASIPEPSSISLVTLGVFTLFGIMHGHAIHRGPAALRSPIDEF